MVRDGDGAIQVITDGSEANTANFVRGYVWKASGKSGSSGRKGRGDTFEPLIDVQTRYWF